MLNLEDINFGACDSETEATLDSGSFLQSVYFDPFNTLRALESGRFIITGRKGTGKSGFAYQMLLNPAPERFVRILKYKHFELRALVEMADQTVNDSSRYALWKWILLCSLFEELCEDNSLQLDGDARKDLQQARKRIAEFVSLDGLRIEEVLRKTKGVINITAFKAVGTASRSSSFDTRETQANFFGLISRVENLLLDLFKKVRDRDNQFVLCIDDLDEGFDGSIEHKNNLVSLIKVAKELFTTFGTNGVKFYPVVLIRQDILESLNTVDGSFNKIISSNTLMYNWYRQSIASTDPEKVPLKRLVNERILHAYATANMPAPSSPIDKLLGDAFPEGTKDPFKVALHGTLFRPRDLVQLFSYLGAASTGRSTITRDVYTRVYRDEFSPFVIREWENELMAFLTPNEIKVILAACKSIDNETFSTATFRERLAKFQVKKSAEEVLSRLHQSGMISNIQIDNDGKKKYNWIYRSESRDNDYVDFDMPLAVHPCLKESFKRRGFFR